MAVPAVTDALFSSDRALRHFSTLTERSLLFLPSTAFSLLNLAISTQNEIFSQPAQSVAPPLSADRFGESRPALLAQALVIKVQLLFY